MNGWFEANDKLQKKLVLNGNPMVICLTETHLRGWDQLMVNGYDYVGLNRWVPERYHRGSGGVGILYKTSLKGDFIIEKCFEWKDNVLGLQCLCKETREPCLVLFRWFKFTLKPPNRITGDKL